MENKRKGGFVSSDGKLVALLTHGGELIAISAMFLLCCVPLVTAGSAFASLYYATMKCVRRGLGYPLKEFFHSMRRTLGKGILLTLLSGIWVGLLLFGRWYAGEGEWSLAPGKLVYDLMLLASAGGGMYLFPVLSRFEMKPTEMLKLSVTMCVRFFPLTFLGVAMTAAVAALQFYVLPIPCILFVPGLWCLALTFLVERALLAYTPDAKQGEEQWFDKKN